jgi:SAM-dependent methyltransferase
MQTAAMTQETTAEIAADYALRVGAMYEAKLARLGIDLNGARILELGPGKNYGGLMMLAAKGAAVAVADRFPAEWEPDFHPELYRRLRADLPGRADLLDAVIEAGSHEPMREIEAPAEAMPQLDTASFDAVLSLAVLEHVVDPGAVFQELARITKPGGVGLHQIDFRDHAHFDRPLDFLLIEDAEYERGGLNWWRGNRMRVNEWLPIYQRAGFDVAIHNVNAFADAAYLADLLPRLRSCPSRFRDIDREDLTTLGLRLGVRHR